MRRRAREGLVDVMLVGSHPITLVGLRAALMTQPEMNVVGETPSGCEALTLARTLSPDVVVVDSRLLDVSGIEAIRRLRQSCPHARIAVICDEEGPWAVRAFLTVGVSAYLLASATPGEIVEAVRCASRGQQFVQREAAKQLASLEGLPVASLTPRELEVLAHLAQGRSNDEIAGALHLATKTVEMHVGNVLAKLNVRSRTQAAITALKSGILGPPQVSAITGAAGDGSDGTGEWGSAAPVEVRLSAPADEALK